MHAPDHTGMKITVLGCSGGISSTARTTSFLVDHDILIDAGTGVGDLTVDALRAIDHVFLTHSHLDHHAALPFLLDTVGASRSRPVTVYAQEVTLAALKQHIYNNVIWPDFSRIPTTTQPFMTYRTLPVGGEIALAGRRIRSLPVTHVVPAVGYLVSGNGGSFAFSGDTTVTDAFWTALNGCTDLAHVVVETSFLDKDEPLARVSQHLCPKLLAGEIKKLKSRAQVHISHLQPGYEDAIMQEIARHVPDNTPRRLMHGDVFSI
jgi:ribonuclease BN (tRNA processing enzyme)